MHKLILYVCFILLFVSVACIDSIPVVAGIVAIVSALGMWYEGNFHVQDL